MSIFDIFSENTVRFKRNSLLDTIDQIKMQLDETVIPSLHEAQSAFATFETKGPLYVRLMDLFYERTGMRKQNDWLADWLLLVNVSRQNLNFLEEQVKKIMENETYSDGLSIQKAQLITAISGLEYMSKQVLTILVLMTAVAQDTVDKTTYVPKKAIDEAVNHAGKIFSLLASYGQPSDKFKKLFAAIPDAVMTPSNKDQVLSVWGEKADPFEEASQSGFVPNLPLLVVDTVAEVRLHIYNRDKSNKKQMEQRIMYLRTRQEGESTAAIEKQIGYYEKEVAKLQDKIDNFEQKYGGR